MSAYVDPEPSELPAPLTADEISVRVFRKPTGWFSRDRVRKRLYGRGFPRPYERGLWSAIAVRRWLETAGTTDETSASRATKPPRKARKRPANGYAAVAGVH